MAFNHAQAHFIVSETLTSHRGGAREESVPGPLPVFSDVPSLLGGGAGLASALPPSLVKPSLLKPISHVFIVP